MNDYEITHAWNNVCETIKNYDNIDPSQIDAFFSRLQPQAMSDGFLMLTADNDFIKTWVENHYIETIKEALNNEFGTEFSVLIELNPNQSVTENTQHQASKQTQPASLDQNAQTNKIKQKEIKEKQNIKKTKPEENSEEAQSTTNNKTKPAETFTEPLNNATFQDETQPTITFENFVIGDSNRMAYTLAVSVAEKPGKAELNPLFIYGKSGLGKTHLLRAIQNYINDTFPHLKTIYVDSSELVNDYTEAAIAADKEKQSYKNFKDRYERADVLLIDDVQFFQGKPATINIVFQIFNKLTQLGKQVVLSADRAPKNIDIDERYQSRFVSGGICDIQPPEMETKLGVIKSYIEEYSESEGGLDFEIPEEIQMFIAENSSSNIRELKSAIVKVIYKMKFENKNLTTQEVQELLEDHFSGGPSKRLSVLDIQKEVENYYKVKHSELVGNKRSRNIAHARQVAMYLSRDLLNLPFGEIGKKFNRDHSTIMYSVTNIEEKMKTSRELKEEMEIIKKMVYEA